MLHARPRRVPEFGRIEKITVDELYDDLLQDYRIKSQTVEWAERIWNVHLKDFFSGMRASHLGTNQITSYVEKRMGEGVAQVHDQS